MSKQTRNRNFAQNTRKNHNKTTGSTTGDKTPWNPAAQQESSPKTSDERVLGRSSGTFRGKSKGMKSHTGPKNPRNLENHRNFDQTTSNAPWIWGYHAVKAALLNPRRTHHKLYVSPNMLIKLDDSLRGFKGELKKVHANEIDVLLPSGAVHQGAALHSAPLPSAELEDIASPAKGLIIVLDQITDPHNVGAMFRLAAAFGARAVIMQTRSAPPLAGAVTKVAVGTVETVPHVLVTNIANTLLALQQMNWRVTGLAGEATISLEQAFVRAEAEVIVMGAEGPGLRKRVRDCCDQLAKIPMRGAEVYGAESLNVSTAASIALYEASRDMARDGLA